jgi:hypothetical protein
MNNNIREKIHAILDGLADPTSCGPEDRLTLSTYQAALQRLEKTHAKAPRDLTERIMAKLPLEQRATLMEWIKELLPQRRQWAVPTLVGAAAMLVIMLSVWRLEPQPGVPQLVQIHFQIHAPGARQVELVGDFNQWTPGIIRLKGPDASGHWTADVNMPEGRYEYQFLVDGTTWVTDPNASIHRPDGFGRENAVIEVFDERS